MFYRLLKAVYKQLLLLPCFLLPWVMLSASFLKFSPWPYSQPPFVFLIMLCVFLSMGLDLYFLSFFNSVNYHETFAIEFNYAAAICFGIAGWSFLVSFFTYIPLLSWTGSPQLGMGILWYIALAIMVISFNLVLNSRYRHLFIINILVASLTIGFLCFFGDVTHGFVPLFKYSPYFINEHSVFIGLSLIGLGLLLDNRYYNKVLFILGVLIIATSYNKTAVVGIAVAAFLGGIAYYINKTEGFVAKHLRYIFSVIIFLIPIFVYLIAKCITSDSFLFSLYSRARFWQACLRALFNEPIRLLVGFGWGSYTDVILAGIQSIPVKIIVPPNITQSLVTQSWSEIGFDINMLLAGSIGFHSHNQFIETLVSTGVIGALLFSLFIILPVLLCDKSKIASMVFCSSALSFIYSGWYELPGTLPYLAVFLAAAVPTASLYKVNFRKVFQFIIPCVSMILLGFGLYLADLNLYFDKVYKKFLGTQPEKILSITVEDYLKCAAPGGSYLAIFLRDFLMAVTRRPLTLLDISVVQNLLYASQNIKTPGLVLVSSLLPVYDYLMNKTDDPRLNEFKKVLLHDKSWDDVINKAILMWSNRVDLILPYFDWQKRYLRKKDKSNFIQAIQ